MLGLYFHIPFCKRRCGYCDFCSTATYDEKMMDCYQQALVTQLEAFFGEKGSTPVDTVYFGGGTPSLWGGKRIGKMLKEIKKRVMLKDCEITVEVNPESCDKALCKALRRAGVNRISMGVQSADNQLLASIGRLHTFAQAKEAVALVKKYVTSNVSLDLIFGLPGQDMDGWIESVQEIIALEPAHISVYALKLEPGCAMYGRQLPMADDDLQADMYLMALELLEKQGYRQYEISNFAKDGKISRHNSKYWDLSEYLGLGASAHSLYKGRRFSFTADIGRYMAGVAQGDSVLDEQEDVPLPLKHRKGEYLMLMLRTARGVDAEWFYRTFGEEFTPYAQRLEKYIAAGYALCDGGNYRLTPTGFLISNTIIGDVLGDL